MPDKDDGRIEVEGILDMSDQGFGFLRFSNFLTSDKDVYVAPTQVRRFNLKTGDKIRGIARPPREGEKFGGLLYVVTVNDDEPGVAMRRPDFDDLTPIFPYERISLFCIHHTKRNSYKQISRQHRNRIRKCFLKCLPIL